MTAKSRATRKKSSEKEIDEIVVTQADDDLAWEESIQVEMDKTTSLSIPAKLAARAAFLAKLHREKGLEEWLTRVIRERVELEETAFAEVKRELKTRQPA
ncbi:MAG: hypothetical protein U1F76_26955 [Candidatus Competibacteraceae bacterium]